MVFPFNPLPDSNSLAVLSKSKLTVTQILSLYSVIMVLLLNPVIQLLEAPLSHSGNVS